MALSTQSSEESTKVLVTQPMVGISPLGGAFDPG